MYLTQNSPAGPESAKSPGPPTAPSPGREREGEGADQTRQSIPNKSIYFNCPFIQVYMHKCLMYVTTYILFSTQNRRIICGSVKYLIYCNLEVKLLHGRGTRGHPLAPKEDYFIVCNYRKSAGNLGLTRLRIIKIAYNPSYILNEHKNLHRELQI